MTHALFPTLAAMLDTLTLSLFADTPIKDVSRVPLHITEAYSGSRFFRIETNGGTGPSFVLKCSSATATEINHTVAAWQHGILDRLPASIEHSVMACAHDDAGYAILMRDMSAWLMPEGRAFALADHARFLDTMTAMHAAFWGNARLTEPDFQLAQLSYFFTHQTTGAEGWELAEQLLKPDVAQTVLTLRRDPQPLYAALARYPHTLVHNDLWWANLGVVRGDHERIVMLDWDFVTLAPPAVDLAFYIGENTGTLPVTDDAVIEAYRDRLAYHLGNRFDDRWWVPQLDLCLLGSFLRRGQWPLLAVTWATDETARAQAEERLHWWSAHVRRGIQWL